MRSRLTLYAEKGQILTDGQVFCTEIQLAEGNDGAGFYEVSEEEAKRLQAEKEAAETEVS
jgi:hypothetical protein